MPAVFQFGYLLDIGTTGRPKGVTISHSALVVQSLAKIAVVGYGEDDVRLSLRNMFFFFIYKILKSERRWQFM